MARTHNIRWTDDDLAEYNRRRKNFNAKRQRLLKKDPTIADFLPEAMTIDKIKTRKDFHRFIKDSDDFLRRGSNEEVEYHGLQVPTFFKDLMNRRIRSQNARRAHQRKQLSREGGTDTLKNEAELAKFNIVEPIKPEQIGKIYQGLDRRTYDSKRAITDEQYKQNYFKAVRENLGHYGNDIIELLQGVSGSTMLDGMRTDMALEIKFVYETQQQAELAKYVLNAWKKFLGKG